MFEAPCLQGRIVEVKGEDDEARVIYDDDMEEWLSLAQERFQWLAPRAQSAGGTPELQVHSVEAPPFSLSHLAAPNLHLLLMFVAVPRMVVTALSKGEAPPRWASWSVSNWPHDIWKASASATQLVVLVKA